MERQEALAHVEVAVVGAGVVGLAIAKALAEAGRDVVVIEAAPRIGSATSSRNSEVVHAGIYYPTGSLKARLAVAGRHLLRDYCAARGVAYHALGKLIVATDAVEEAALERLSDLALANGVDDLERLSRNTIARLEPALRTSAALLSPSTAIVDSHQLMLALLGDAEAAGASLALNTPVEAAADGDGQWRLRLGGRDPATLATDWLVNSAGLSAPALAARFEGLAPAFVPPGYFCRGCYFTLDRKAPFSHLIYPAPEAAGLGVHLTLDLAGGARFGPDVEWIDRIDYTVDPKRGDRFYAAIRRYWPDLPDHALQPAYAGIRPKIAGPDAPAADFRIDGPDFHGLPGLVNLFGIESPGLTASLAIAAEVQAIIDGRG